MCIIDKTVYWTLCPNWKIARKRVTSFFCYFWNIVTIFLCPCHLPWIGILVNACSNTSLFTVLHTLFKKLNIISSKMCFVTPTVWFEFHLTKESIANVLWEHMSLCSLSYFVLLIIMSAVEQKGLKNMTTFIYMYVSRQCRIYPGKYTTLGSNVCRLHSLLVHVLLNNLKIIFCVKHTSVIILYLINYKFHV